MNSLFKALNDPTRRQILEMLRVQSLTAGEIAEACQVGKPTVSHHLDILRQAELIEEERQGKSRRYHLNRLSIIGHSKGGLIGHYYIRRLGGHKRVRTLITLGTPHYGNPIALFGLLTPLALISKSIWQMTPMSPFIRRLNRGRFPRNVRLVSIYSKRDRICFYKSAELDIPKGCRNLKNVELKGMGHADYPMRKEAYDVIRRELLAGEKS